MTELLIPYYDYLKAEGINPEVGDKIRFDKLDTTVDRIDENFHIYTKGGRWLCGTPYNEYSGCYKVFCVNPEQVLDILNILNFRHKR